MTSSCLEGKANKLFLGCAKLPLFVEFGLKIPFGEWLERFFISFELLLIFICYLEKGIVWRDTSVS